MQRKCNGSLQRLNTRVRLERKRLSSTGASGKHAQDCARDLRRALGYPSGAPEFKFIGIPTSRGFVEHPFLLPHEFFSTYFHYDYKRFIKHMLGDHDPPARFWESIKSSEFLSTHPSLPPSSWPHTLPLGLHGDGGMYSKQDALYVLTWNSLLGAGTTIKKDFWQL